MAAPKRTRNKQSPGSKDDPRVPRSGSEALPRESVAERDQSPGAPLEERGPLQEPLPNVPSPPSPSVVPTTAHGARIDPRVIEAALQRARTDGLYTTVRWDAKYQKWVVPSRTIPGQFYTVKRRYPTIGKGAWWDVLYCSCDNERQRRRVCWHKAAVTLHWKARRWLPSELT